MKIIALISVRNESLYIERCLRHLISNGINAIVIDNDSEDNTKKISGSFLGNGVERIVRQPFFGYFDLVEQCRLQERLAREIDADWFIHHDADEIMEPPTGYATLFDAISVVDQAGYSAINCDEFVFVPTNEDERFEETDYVERMRFYYFFEPTKQRLVRMWRKHAAVALSASGGHGADFPGRRIFPTPFVLRHYIGLSAEYLRAKYNGRTYSETERRELGWHGWRAEFDHWRVTLPARNDLNFYAGDGSWDKSDPKHVHQFLSRK